MRSYAYACILVALSVAGTRYLWPRIEYKETVKTVETVKKDIVTVVREVTRPDGTHESTTTTTDHSTEASTRSSSVTKASQPQWSAGLLLQKSAQHWAEAPVYALLVQRRVLGPVWVGAGVSTDKQVMGIISLEF